MIGTSHGILAGVQRRRRTIIQGFLWTLFGVVALTILLNAALLGSDMLSVRALAPNLTFLAVIGAALRLNHRHHFRAALGIIIALVLLAASLQVLVLGVGASAAILFLFFIPVTLAGLLLGRTALYLTGGWTLLVVLLTPFLARSGLLPSGAPPAEPSWPLALQFALVFSVVAFFLDRFGTSLQDALIGMAEREAALTREMAERRKAEERLGMALSVARMATFDMDLVTREVQGSSDLETLYGMTPTGKARALDEFFECMHPDDREALTRVIEGRQGAPGGERDEFRVRDENGGTRWLGSVSKTVPGEDGAPARIVGVVLDITGTKTAQQALQGMNATLEQRIRERTSRLEEANRELETFAYTVSHDLRAPLRSINGFSRVLVEDYGEVLDETAKGYIARIEAGATRMDELIDDVMDLSRLARTDMERTSVDLGEVAADVARELDERHPGPPVTLDVRGEVLARGDAQLLRIALENLMANAWKFMGDQDAPRVRLGTERVDGSKVFFVRDNGTGFDMQYASKLFAPFQRLHNDRGIEGTGIGLATVQRIVHRHGGRIWAESAPGAGATFFFTLAPD